ncbi:GGDEF domain-containing protein [Marinicella gelatinilytica]|uniref:GGDEF domain-containing protein n=1 Tax=Marinicella gelatinilytica TaxID=2996017 RepID=UPI0022609D99|nr:GGDEF domain-containing protein [Marinicella gelatinilytica]MCX7545367.1 GGDEF domain-containing protein [Marinicella gelatinilytica]
MVVMCIISITTSAADFETADAQFQNLKSDQDKLAWVKKYEPEVTQWPTIDQAYFYHRKGLTLEVNDDIDGAKEQFVKSIQLFKSLDEIDPGLVASLIDLSYMKYLQTNEAKVYCPDRQEAVTVARQIDAPIKLADALIQLSYCYQFGFENLAKGLAVLEEAASVVHENNLAKGGLAMIYNATGNLYRNNQVHQQAYDYYQQAHQLWVDVDDTQDVFNMLHNMNSEAIELGKWQQAEAHVNDLFAMAEKYTDFSDFRFFAEFNAGRLAFEQQNFSQAVESYEAALALQDTTPEVYFVNIARRNLATAYFRLGHHDEAFQMAKNYLDNDISQTDTELPRIILLFAENNHEQALEVFWKLFDNTRANNREFVKNAVALQALNFGETIDKLQNQASQQQLAIKELELEQQQKQSRINQLTAVVVGLFAMVAVITAWFLYRSKKHHQSRARTDYLTHIANRRHIIQEGRRMLLQCQSKQQDFSVIIIDIDDFKPINDEYGHATGDVVIKQVVNSMRAGLSDGQMLGRIGGEEFLMLLPNINKGRAHAIAEHVRQHVADTLIAVDEIQLSITVSLGVAVNQPPVANFEELLRRADEALYRAKTAGKNQVQPALSASASL